MGEHSAKDPGPPVVEIVDVHKYFGDHHVLRGIDLTLRRGEVVVLIGPSGSGKSTLLRCINHLERIDRGRILVDGRPMGYRDVDGRRIELRDAEVARQRREVGMVFQQFNLFPHLTALENITAGPIHVLGTSAADAEAGGRRLLELVGLSHKADAYPTQLSGGQQQRVAIARALAMKPQVMLFDEPTSALDPEMITEVLDVMLGLSRRGTTMLVVTHEMGFARAAAGRIIFMDDGRLVEEAPPDRFFTAPREDRTRQFLAKILH
jgi:ABC-type polar amino acid transport system ATPase subunit